MSSKTTHCVRSYGMGWGSANAVGGKTLAPHRIDTVMVDIVLDPLRDRPKLFNAALLSRGL